MATETPYFLAAAPPPSSSDAAAGGRRACWDPNAPGCWGVSQEDGIFCYGMPDGRELHFSLFAAAQLLPVDDLDDGGARASLRPAPVSIPWAHWSFVPGQPGALLFVQRTDQLLQTSLPMESVVDPSARARTRAAYGCTTRLRPRPP